MIKEYHMNQLPYIIKEVIGCSIRIQSYLLHYKGGEGPQVKEFPMEKGLGWRYLKGFE